MGCSRCIFCSLLVQFVRQNFPAKIKNCFRLKAALAQLVIYNIINRKLGLMITLTIWFTYLDTSELVMTSCTIIAYLLWGTTTPSSNENYFILILFQYIHCLYTIFKIYLNVSVCVYSIVKHVIIPMFVYCKFLI